VTTERRRRGCLSRLLWLLLPIACGAAGAWWWEQTEAIAALERQRDELRSRLLRARATDADLVHAPEADVLIGMPVAFTSALARQLTQGLLDHVRIVLREIRVHKQGEVKTKLLLRTIEPGHYALDLTLHEARAVLRPGTPRVDFHGERLGLTLPVTVSEGQGHATVNLDWDSRGIGRMVCEDFRVSQEMSATVVPRTYEVKGAFTLAVEGGRLVARPAFPDLVLRLNVEPSPEAWAAIEETIKARSWTCQTVLHKVDVPKHLREWLGRGFDVHVPPTIFKPVRLPAAVEQSVAFEGKLYGLGVRLFDLRWTPQILWYGANVDVRPLEVETK
jgi:hypothetical protein